MDAYSVLWQQSLKLWVLEMTFIRSGLDNGY